jgi:hypothetical protein
VVRSWKTHWSIVPLEKGPIVAKKFPALELYVIGVSVMLSQFPDLSTLDQWRSTLWEELSPKEIVTDRSELSFHVHKPRYAFADGTGITSPPESRSRTTKMSADRVLMRQASGE